MAPRGSSGSSGVGNTKPPRVSSAKNWCFTWNNSEKHDGSMAPEIWGLELAKLGKYGFGVETAPTTGTVHYQGWISFDTKCRPKEKIKIPSIHWEPMKGNIDQNIAYCSKEGKYYTNYEPFLLEDDLADGNYKPWQREIIDLINGPVDKRKVYWYYDLEGGTGKSALVRHLEIQKKIIGLTGGKSSDIAFMLTQYKPEQIKAVIIDLPRCSGGLLSFDIIEQIKNGKVFSPKYESKCLMFNSPHLIILSNAPPDQSEMRQLSADRWVVRKIE